MRMGTVLYEFFFSPSILITSSSLLEPLNFHFIFSAFFLVVFKLSTQMPRFASLCDGLTCHLQTWKPRNFILDIFHVVVHNYKQCNKYGANLWCGPTPTGSLHTILTFIIAHLYASCIAICNSIIIMHYFFGIWEIWCLVIPVVRNSLNQ